ncbi:MAG: hypothetical protein SPL60_06655, partial [Lachnospiraceae bacterium]|nr:hypothetical protein [Lachnospiraceae bacterium]
MAVIKCPLMDKEVEKFECNNSSIEEQVKDSYFITLLKQAYGHQIIIMLVVGTKTGTVTDVDGHYQMSIPAGSTLRIS